MATPESDSLIAELRDQLAKMQPDASVDANKLWGFLDEFERRRQAARTAAIAEELAQQQALNVHLQVMGSTIDKASAYTNLIIVAGYASYFALLGPAKTLTQPSELRMSILLMILSVGVFVGFEVFKMIFMQLSMLSAYAGFKAEIPRPGFDYVESTKRLEKKLNDLKTRFQPVWHVCIVVSVLSGLAAMLLLAAPLASDLLLPELPLGNSRP